MQVGDVPMVVAPDSSAQAQPGRRKFVLVACSCPTLILDAFEATDWAPAIMEYVARLRRGIYDQPVSLREARPGETVPGGR